MVGSLVLPAILAFILEEKLLKIHAQHAQDSKVVTVKALVRFDVEVETQVSIDQYADGTFIIPPKDALRLPAIEEAKRKVATGNCQAKFTTFDIVIEHEKAEAEI